MNAVVVQSVARKSGSGSDFMFINREPDRFSAFWHCTFIFSFCNRRLCLSCRIARLLTCLRAICVSLTWIVMAQEIRGHFFSLIESFHGQMVPSFDTRHLVSEHQASACGTNESSHKGSGRLFRTYASLKISHVL